MEAIPRAVRGLYLPSYFSSAYLAPGVQVENLFPSFVLSEGEALAAGPRT